MPSLTLYLIRHGETAWNAQSRLQGQTEIPLAPTGREQARQLAAHWASDPPPFTHCYSSDLSRAQETAQILLDSLPSSPHLQTDTRLRERNFGVWEGLTPQERSVKFGEIDTRDCPEGGEFWEDVWARMLDFLQDLWQKHAPQDATILIVGHGGSLRCLLAYAAGLPVQQLRQYRLENTSVSIITLITLSGETLKTSQALETLEALEALNECQKVILLLADTKHLQKA